MQKISETLKFVIIGAIVLVASMVAFFLGYLYRKKIAEKTIKSAEQEAQRIVEEAKKQAEAYKKEATLLAKEEIHRARSEFDREVRERRAELQRFERKTYPKRRDA